MDPHSRWPRILIIIGLVLMIFGFLDPLEGSLIIAPGSGIAALGAFLAEGRGRKLSYWGCGLTVLGVAILWGLSAIGGIGGDTGRSMWWGLLLLPYPIGWIMGLVGAVRSLKKSL